MSRILTWLDHRTGYRSQLHEALYENIPSGARFRYVTGSMLVFAFVVQVVTGIFLWMAYSPSSDSAWESVYFIQYEMNGGWLLRGVHHFMAQAMIVVMGLHLLQVIVDGAYRAPREINYWLGIILMQIVLGLGLTGYLLPWDQKGYWATNVATNLMTLVPFVGQDIQRLALGGPDYGHHTLTRFFAMHAGVLPILLVVFLAMHVALFRRHGITAKIKPGRPDAYFWPSQVLYDGIACMVMLTVVLLLCVHFDVAGLATGELADAHRGAELGAPADPSEQYSAARPEWYFLSLFQLLKYFKSEFVGAIVVPGAIMLVLVLAPIIGIFRVGHWFNVAFILSLCVGAGALTVLAVYEDWDKKEYLEAKEEADRDAKRVKELIHRRKLRDDGTLSPPLMIQLDAISLLRNDPLTQGPKLFKKHCASCHEYLHPEADQRFALFREPKTHPLKEKQTQDDLKVVREGDQVVYEQPSPGAPDLYGFASREWIRGLLDPKQIDEFAFAEPQKSKEHAKNPDHPSHFREQIDAPYFGNTAHKKGRMVQWVKKHLGGEKPALSAEELDDVVSALSAQAQLPAQAKADEKDAASIARGVKLIQGTCTSYCHKFGDDGQWGLAPDLTGYGSYEWMLGLVSDPAHERYYRNENDRMPSFAEQLDKPATNTVSVRELSLIVDWIRGQYYVAGSNPPVLPHGPDEAQRAVELARVLPPGLEFDDGISGETSDKGLQRRRAAERLFRLNCAGCHSHVDPFGQGIAATSPSAPNLYGFASRKWLVGLLDPKQIGGPAYFGKTSHADGEMSSFVSDSFGEDADEETLALRDKVIAALSAEAALPAQKEADAKAEKDGVIEEGRMAIAEGSFDGGSCVDCHTFRDNEGDTSYPDLTGYGSREWLIGMISNPESEHHYSSGNDRMPAFAAAEEGSDKRLLSPQEIELLARWLRGENLSQDASAAKPAE